MNQPLVRGEKSLESVMSVDAERPGILGGSKMPQYFQDKANHNPMKTTWMSQEVSKGLVSGL